VLGDHPGPERTGVRMEDVAADPDDLLLVTVKPPVSVVGGPGVVCGE